jgi:hypothetical protein
MTSVKELSNNIPLLDGTNWLLWESMMGAYLQASGLFIYVSGKKTYQALTTEEMITFTNPKADATVVASLRALLDLKDIWAESDQKAVGIITLKLLPMLQHLVGDTSKETWDTLKVSYGTPGSASIYTDFLTAIKWQFKENEDPNISISKLQSIFNRLETNNFQMPEIIRVMIILAALPLGWDNIASTLLATLDISRLTLKEIVPTIVDEDKRQGVRSSSAHYPQPGGSNFR